LIAFFYFDVSILLLIVYNLHVTDIATFYPIKAIRKLNINYPVCACDVKI